MRKGLQKGFGGVQRGGIAPAGGAGYFARPLRVVLIGGHERTSKHLIERGETAGWKVETHPGAVGGRGAKVLRSQIGRADIVFVITQLNSHGSMFLAKDCARRLGREMVVIRREKFADIEDAILRYQARAGRE
ncbi:MAG: DUF2325 domain-containing protein [Acidobacteriota bacterium]|jgi:hypothetical protein|nr:DUF2325 domain-containing protein [Acidobacteriota bacterium]